MPSIKTTNRSTSSKRRSSSSFSASSPASAASRLTFDFDTPQVDAISGNTPRVLPRRDPAQHPLQHPLAQPIFLHGRVGRDCHFATALFPEPRPTHAQLALPQTHTTRLSAVPQQLLASLPRRPRPRQLLGR